MRLSAIVVNHNGESLLRDALGSLAGALSRAGMQHETVVVDNASTDGSRRLVRSEFPGVRLVEMDRNTGFSTAVDAGIARTSGEWVLLLNNDAVIEVDALRRIFDLDIADDVGAIAMQMRFARRPDLVNSAGIGLDVLYVCFERLIGTPVDGEAARPAEVFGASGGAVVYRRSMLADIGGIDTGIFLYLEDVDVAWRASMAGWRTLYIPEAVSWHQHSATSGHGSDLKYFHVGRSRMRVLARNADRRHLLRYGPAILAYELGYVGYVALVDRSLAPLRGRLAGLREWRSVRAAGAPLRRPIPLAPRQGYSAALRRRRAALAGRGRPRAA